MSGPTSQATTARRGPNSGAVGVPVTSIHKVEADGVQVFYRAAGDMNAPVVLLLHGFPTPLSCFANSFHAWPTSTA